MRLFMNRIMKTGLALILMAVAGFLACGSNEKAKESRATPISGVQLETVHLQAVPELYEATGTVRSATSSVISAQIGGTVLERRVKPGDRVKRGQVLALLDDRTPRAQLASAEAGVVEASQGLAEADQALQAAAADRQFAEATFKRYQRLLEKNSLSRQEFEGAEARYKSALANERALQAKKKQIEARGQQASSQKESAQAVFSYSRVASPIDGVVTMKAVDPGTVVMPGTPLLTVEDTAHYRLEASVPEQFMGRLTLGMNVDMEAGVGKFQGRVAEIVPAADAASRTFLVKVDLPRECDCRSGQYGTASFQMGEETRLTVPRQAITEHGGLEGVYVVNKEGKSEYRLVKTGKTVGERVEILAGLGDGDRVATSQIERLQDGARVEVQ
jgi:RND family efflux transporter MFP subunit